MFKEQFKKALVLSHTLKVSLAGIFFISLFLLTFALSNKNTVSILRSPLPDTGLLFPKVQAQTKEEKKYEVFGFAPYWSFKKLDNVDFNTLTTLAYFGVPVSKSGDLVKNDPGYTTFMSQKATEIFQKAHNHETKVVLTITQMNNKTIKQILDDEAAQHRTVQQTLSLVKARGIDGVNIDFEYTGDPGDDYMHKFTNFVDLMNEAMKANNLTTSTSVYAISASQLKMYDIQALAQRTDKIFMMAYDYATASAKSAIPTAPLYGHKEGEYWYDVATAVDDFLSKMPSDKLILGTPWYGYNVLVYEPGIKAETRPRYSWRGKPTAQTYGNIEETISPNMPGILDYKEGWDDLGKTRWKAYHVASTNTWRMIFYDDIQSLGIKYDFAKTKDLAGVGIWALGFDNGRPEMWDLLRAKFGSSSQQLSMNNK